MSIVESQIVTSKSVRVARPEEFAETLGPQQQRLIPCITARICGAEGISAGMVRMPPNAASRAHYHAHSEIIVCCLRGNAATLIGPRLEPYFHGPGEFIYIPEGVIHVAVNLSATEELVAIEMRTDPMFNDDVLLTPHYDAHAAEVVSRLRSEIGQAATA
jgi:uncharacterized RmlC-like cupin family protein